MHFPNRLIYAISIYNKFNNLCNELAIHRENAGNSQRWRTFKDAYNNHPDDSCATENRRVAVYTLRHKGFVSFLFFSFFFLLFYFFFLEDRGLTITRERNKRRHRGQSLRTLPLSLKVDLWTVFTRRVSFYISHVKRNRTNRSRFERSRFYNCVIVVTENCEIILFFFFFFIRTEKAITR